MLVALTLVLMARPAPAQTPVVEAKSADGSTMLQVNADGGLLVPGTFNAGIIPVEGAGTRLMWHPAKAAFRAGRVGVFSDGTEWDDASVGDESVAFGRNTMASGDRSVAMGDGTTASGFRSFTTGFQTTASGGASTAMGFGTTASGSLSMALGDGAVASGDLSTVMGLGTTAPAYASLVIGRHNVAEGTQVGWVETDPLFVAGNGSSSNHSNALTLLKNGDLTIAGTLTESSDRRLKTDITPLGDVLAALNDIQPVRYHFKAGTSRPTGPQLGLIAQEVERAFPELVTRGADGYLSVAYPKLTAVLLRALHEQQTEIEVQRKEVKALRAANVGIQEQLARLAARLEQLVTAHEAVAPPIDATPSSRLR